MIICSELTKAYGKSVVVDSLSFQVKPGEVYALLGSNGAGKTTTIKMILGLTRLTGGQIHIDEGIRIAYSPETPYFHGFLSAVEVMLFFGKLQKLPKEKMLKQIEDILQLVGLWDNRHKKIKTYSKGMIQRLAIAQSLLGDPDLLLLDEPAAGLDAVGRVQILELINHLKKKGKTMILNSHILSDVQRVADRGFILDRGQMLQEWCIQELDGHSNLEELFLDAVGKGNGGSLC